MKKCDLGLKCSLKKNTGKRRKKYKETALVKIERIWEQQSHDERGGCVR